MWSISLTYQLFHETDVSRIFGLCKYILCDPNMRDTSVSWNSWCVELSLRETVACPAQIFPHTFKFLDADMFNLLHKSLVRPQVEYASSVWSPTLKMDINSLEKVQRRATKLVPQISTLSYPERLQYLKLPTLQYRRLRQDLIFIFKHSKQLISLDTKTHCKVCLHNPDMLSPSLSLTTRGHLHKFQIHHHQGIRNRFLTSRALTTWNNLNIATVKAKTVNCFKNMLGTDLSMQNKYLPF